MERLAVFLGCSLSVLRISLVYVCLQVLVFVLYGIVLKRNKLNNQNYQRLLLLNVVFNVFVASTATIATIGCNFGAMLCISAFFVMIAFFESYTYYCWVLKLFKRDDV